MRQLRPYSLWLGHVGDAWDLSSVLEKEIKALVDLAAMEKSPKEPEYEPRGLGGMA